MKTKNRKHTVIEVVCDKIRLEYFKETITAAAFLKMMCNCNKDGHIGYFIWRFYKTEDSNDDRSCNILPGQFYKKIAHHTDPKVRAIFQSIIHAVNTAVYDDAAWTTTFRFELNEWYGVGVENTYVDIIKAFLEVVYADVNAEYVKINVIKPTKGE